MAGMIEGIFGVMPSDVRLAELERQQDMSAELVKRGSSPFAATFGTAFGGELAKGLMSRLGLETPAMSIAKSNQQEAQQFVYDYRNAKTPEQLEELKISLIAKNAPESTVNAIDRRIDKIRELSKPVQAKDVSKQDIDIYAPTIDKAATNFNVDIGEFEGSDQGAYYASVMNRVNQNAALIQTQINQGARDQQGRPVMMPTKENMVTAIVQNDIRNGVLSEKNENILGFIPSFGASTKTEYNPAQVQGGTFLNRETGEIYDLRRQNQE